MSRVGFSIGELNRIPAVWLSILSFVATSVTAPASAWRSTKGCSEAAGLEASCVQALQASASRKSDLESKFIEALYPRDRGGKSQIEAAGAPTSVQCPP